MAMNALAGADANLHADGNGGALQARCAGALSKDRRDQGVGRRGKGQR
ncbi:hypothetical protein XCR_2882 [Xanthomonas campestris pv. raphani 756C]|nr:hypothetical protein XCR_2882 [Xanthomonas campestris pv. raphani 756C]